MSASLAFVRGIHRGPVNSPHRGPVTRKMFSFDDVIIAWITWLRARWLIDAQAIINQNKANLRRIKSPLNNMFNSSRDKSFFTSIKILGWMYLSIPKFQRCSSSSWSLRMDIFEVKLTVRGQQHSFSTHERVFLWKCQSFWDRNCLDLRGARTPNLRIHAECSKLLSYQGQTFAVPCFEHWLWRYRYFWSKVNIWIRNFIHILLGIRLLIHKMYLCQ